MSTDFHRDVFASRLRHELAQETHVIVGDHPPEPRVAHELGTIVFERHNAIGPRSDQFAIHGYQHFVPSDAPRWPCRG